MEDSLESIEIWRMLSCTKCKHAVWPQEIIRHFRSKEHKVKLRDAQRVQRKAMQQYPDAIQDPTEWEHPSAVIAEVPQLKLYENGFRCQNDPTTCHVIRQTKEGIRKHCSEVHYRTMYAERGRPNKAATKRANASERRLWKQVKYFQRAFAQGPHSRYVEVRARPRPDQRPAQTSKARTGRVIDQQIGEIIQAGEEAKANANKVIEEGSVDEVNRWVDRTKWSQQLKGFNHEALLDLIVKPDPESELVENAIWNAMDGLGRFSQQTVARRAGLFVRFEAIRSEQSQTRYVPL
jgi:hypothetical protein